MQNKKEKKNKNQRTLNTHTYDRCTHTNTNTQKGGYVALTPKHHELYLEYWCYYLQIPILSVNYRKAPEFKFPHGFNDAFNVYKQCVLTNGGCIGIQFNDKNNEKFKILVCGDSAGGCLTAAVTAKAIADKLPTPKGIIMAYPLLDCSLVFCFFFQIFFFLIAFVFLKIKQCIFLQTHVTQNLKQKKNCEPTNINIRH